MKTLKNYFAFVITYGLLMSFGCNSDELETIDTKIQFDNRIIFKSELSFLTQHTYLIPPDSKEIIRTTQMIRGTSLSKHLNKFELSLSHIAYEIELGESMHVSDGQFEITCDNGDQIFGSYEGFGNLKDKRKELTLVFRILDGNGFYEGATGYLESQSHQASGHPNARSMNIKGVIKRLIL